MLCSNDRDGRSERERIRLFREREERERLMRKRNWLEVEKQRLDADRMEREFLERERLRVEYERRREQERIHREREELRRQQEQLRFEQERRPIKRPYDMDGRLGQQHSDYNLINALSSCIIVKHVVFLFFFYLNVVYMYICISDNA